VLSECFFWIGAYIFIEVFIEYSNTARRTAGVVSGYVGILGKAELHATSFRKLGTILTLLANFASLVLSLNATTEQEMFVARTTYMMLVTLGAEVLIFLALVPTISTLITDLRKNQVVKPSSSFSERRRSLRSASISEGNNSQEAHEKVKSEVALVRAKSFFSRMGTVQTLTADEQQAKKITTLAFNLQVMRLSLYVDGLALFGLQLPFIVWPYLYNKLLYQFIFLWILISPLCASTFVILPVRRKFVKVRPHSDGSSPASSTVSRTHAS